MQMMAPFDAAESVSTSRAGVLYISYDGMLEPLGEGQVIAYLEKLAAHRPITLVSFEKPQDLANPSRMAAMRTRLETAGIGWHPLRYHKSPSVAATAYDIAAGTATATRLARRHGIRIVHARSYVAACIALALKRMLGVRFVFDMRGFWVDERVEAGLWPKDGLLFRFGKAFERRFLRGADRVVTLTEASARELARRSDLGGPLPPISVIPTCVDLARFPARVAAPDGPLTIGHVGSVGTWSDFDRTLRFFAAIRMRRPDARLLVLSRSDPEAISRVLAAAGVPDGHVEVSALAFDEVPRQLQRMHAGTAFYRPGYSRIATAPTKLAEYLSSGVPCVSDATVGDVGRVLEENRVGIAIPDTTDASLQEGAGRLLALLADPDLGDRCSAVAGRMFALASGVTEYERIYSLLGE